MELRDYFRILRQRWVIIVLVTLLALAGASALTLTATPQYQSTARLFVSTPESNSTDAYQGGLFSQQRVKSYASLVTGEEMSRRVVEELGLALDPRALADQISATVEPDTVVLSISVTDDDPATARELAQTTAEQFTAYVAELETPPGKTTAPVKASITDSATTPEGPISPQPVRNLGLAVVLGLLAGFGLAVARDTLDTRIKSPKDLATATGDAPALGHIEYDKTTARQPLITQIDRHSTRAEAFRVLRTNLQFVNVDAANRVFVVTSALPSEGKSTTSCNIALALADADFKVLLVEGDLRRPKAVQHFGLEPSVGVTSVLLGQLELDEAVQEAGPKCDVLASGPTPPNPAELLQSEAMHRLVEAARSTYDYVIVDTPPLLPVTDAAIMASQADGAVLVVRHNHTTRDQVEMSMERLSGVGARLIGTITNMSPPAKKGSAYGYGYGYGYATIAENPAVGRRRRGAAPEGGVTPKRRSGQRRAVDDLVGPTRADEPVENQEQIENELWGTGEPPRSPRSR